MGLGNTPCETSPETVRGLREGLGASCRFRVVLGSPVAEVQVKPLQQSTLKAQVCTLALVDPGQVLGAQGFGRDPGPGIHIGPSPEAEFPTPPRHAGCRVEEGGIGGEVEEPS